MDYFVIEARRECGDEPWCAVNVVRSQGGRLAIDFAERLRKTLHPQISRHMQRVRPVCRQEYMEIGTELARRYKCQDRLDQMEGLLIGCDALISI